MKIAAAVVDSSTFTQVQERISFVNTYTTKRQDLLTSLADLSVQIDMDTFVNNCKYDLIYVHRPLTNLTKLNEISFCEIDNYLWFVNQSRSFNKSSFVCTPHTLSLLGSLYKLNYEKYKDANVDYPMQEDEKLFYGIARLGINVKYI